MPGEWLLAIALIFLAVAYGLIVWQRSWVAKLYEFLGEVKVELKKVTWPGRREVWGTTSVVIAAVFFFGIFLSIVDVLVTWARSGIFSAIGLGTGAGPQ